MEKRILIGNKYFIDTLDIYEYREEIFANNEMLLVTDDTCGKYIDFDSAREQFLNILEMISKRPYATCIFDPFTSEQIGFRFAFYESNPCHVTYLSRNKKHCTLWVRFHETNDIKFTTHLEIDSCGSINKFYPSVVYPKHLIEQYKNDNIIDIFYDKILPNIYKVLDMDYTIERNLVFNNVKCSKK